jgi:integrase
MRVTDAGVNNLFFEKIELGPFGPLMIFSVGTGVRREEAYGVEWSDVDLDHRVVTISRAYAKAG